MGHLRASCQVHALIWTSQHLVSLSKTAAAATYMHILLPAAQQLLSALSLSLLSAVTALQLSEKCTAICSAGV